MKKTKKRPHLNLGQRIASFREHLGWNQEKLAYESGVSLSVIKDMERGVKEGRLQSRLDLTKAMGRSLAELYAEPSSSQSQTKAPLPSREYFATMIESPQTATLDQVRRMIHELATGSETRRAMALGLIFGNFEIAESYIPEDAPKLRALLKVL